VAQALRGHVFVRTISDRRGVAPRLRTRTTAMGTGLALLMCLTTWAVASVSLWMVPAYLALMGLIFVTPRNHHRLLGLVRRSTKPAGDDERDQCRTPSMVGAGEAATVRDTDPSGADSTAIELTVDPIGCSPASVGGGTVKQWRGRTRIRRTSKAAAEAVAALPSVAWIRVGPGKFVRADLTTHATVQVQSLTQPDLCAASADPSALVRPSPTETTETVADKPNCNPLHSSESKPEDVVESYRDVLGSATKGHGIAPAAFGSAPSSSAVPECLDAQAPHVRAEPTFEAFPVASFSGKSADCDSYVERSSLQDERSTAKARWVLCRFTGANSAGYRTYRRSNAGTSCKPRASVWSLVGTRRLRQQLSRRSPGRVFRRRRALRPRSPPSLERRHAVPERTSQHNRTCFDANCSRSWYAMGRTPTEVYAVYSKD